jgi:acid phosphatase (class A)
MAVFARTFVCVFCFGISLAMGLPMVAEAAEAHYVTTVQVDLGQLLPPPPASDSIEERRDLDAVIEASKSRTPVEAERAHADSTISILRFGNVMGAGFTAENLPFAQLFFSQVASDTHAIVSAAKVDFDRLRPFVVDSRINPILNDPEGAATPHHRSGSYPSGHSTFAYVTAVLLAAMVPEKSAEIFARAADFSHNRLIAGVHYPTDIEAGRVAGTVIANVMLHDARFQSDFARARIEVRRAVSAATE